MFDGVFVVAARRLHQFLAARWAVAVFPAEPVDLHVDAAQFGVDIVALGQLGNVFLPLRKILFPLARVRSDTERAAEMVEDDGGIGEGAGQVCQFADLIKETPTTAVNITSKIVGNASIRSATSMSKYISTIGILKKIITIHIQDKENNSIKLYALFNPIINKYSKETVVMEEGCLSLPRQFAEIERPQSIQLQYTNEKNKIVEKEINGYEARILQHEIDHLSGKLFIDYLSSLKRNILIKKVKKLKKLGKI